jgi:hypothetical protein
VRDTVKGKADSQMNLLMNTRIRASGQLQVEVDVDVCDGVGAGQSNDQAGLVDLCSGRSHVDVHSKSVRMCLRPLWMCFRAVDAKQAPKWSRRSKLMEGRALRGRFFSCRDFGLGCG